MGTVGHRGGEVGVAAGDDGIGDPEGSGDRTECGQLLETQEIGSPGTGGDDRVVARGIGDGSKGPGGCSRVGEEGVERSREGGVGAEVERTVQGHAAVHGKQTGRGGAQEDIKRASRVQREAPDAEGARG